MVVLKVLVFFWFMGVLGVILWLVGDLKVKFEWKVLFLLGLLVFGVNVWKLWCVDVVVVVGMFMGEEVWCGVWFIGLDLFLCWGVDWGIFGKREIFGEINEGFGVWSDFGYGWWDGGRLVCCFLVVCLWLFLWLWFIIGGMCNLIYVLG